MTPRSLPLMNRLRRHRGLWLLVVLVMLIKLASGAVCLADGARSQPSSAVATLSMAASPASQGDDCLLGEGGACHCACAHMATLPASVSLAVGSLPAIAAQAAFVAGRVPSRSSSLLRPPIA